MLPLHYPCLVELYSELDDFPTKKNYVMASGIPSLYDMYLEDYESEIARVHDLSADKSLVVACKMNQSYRAMAILNLHDKYLNHALTIDDWTAFKWACENEMIEVVMKMIQVFRSNESFRNSQPFWDACHVPDASISLEMIESFTLQEIKDMIRTDLPPLYIACISGSNLAVEKLITKFGDQCEPDYMRDKCGSTALMVADDCSVRTISLLVDTFGMRCNPAHVRIGDDDDDRTALIVMCITGNPRKAMILLDAFGHHCKPEHVTKNGKSALSYAKEHDMTDVIIKLKSLGIKIDE